MMTNHAKAGFFMDLSIVDDPYPDFEYLRSQGSVIPMPAHNTAALVDFEEELAIQQDNENFSAANSLTGPIPPLPFTPESAGIAPQIEEHRSEPRRDILIDDEPSTSRLTALHLSAILFVPGDLRVALALHAVRRTTGCLGQTPDGDNDRITPPQSGTENR